MIKTLQHNVELGFMKGILLFVFRNGPVSRYFLLYFGPNFVALQSIKKKIIIMYKIILILLRRDCVEITQFPSIIIYSSTKFLGRKKTT